MDKIIFHRIRVVSTSNVQAYNMRYTENFKNLYSIVKRVRFAFCSFLFTTCFFTQDCLLAACIKILRTSCIYIPKFGQALFQTFCAAAGNSRKHPDASRLFAYAVSRCVTATFHYTFSRSLSAYYDSITKAYGTLCRHLLKRSYIQGTNWACLLVHVPSNVSRLFQETISFPTYAFPMISRHVMIKLYDDLLTIVK